ncbi:MAG: decapping endonuclease targeting mRNA [Cirrosporium novae-zelandiae]|nr:MAG: decapping endonuclease targeting mRNA [Cirrosporium novae-zelandiae]
MQRFEAHPISRFAGTSRAIRRPREIACFSYDAAHNFRLDDSSMRWYYPPRVPVDLSRGFETFQQLDDTADDHLESLLDTIIDLEKKTGQLCEADIITWRGMMTKIMATPFDNFNGFEMNATLYQVGAPKKPAASFSIAHVRQRLTSPGRFIEENHAYKLEQKRAQNSQRPRPGLPSQELMSFWGYKFETLSLLPQPWDQISREFIESREKHIVGNYVQYCSVVRTGIGRCKLVIGGEVDAIWDARPHDPNDPINWVELKTTQEPLPFSPPSLLKHERKLLKFWIQSFLLGVPKIVVGYRDQMGWLRRIEEMDTAKIPGHVKRDGTSSWDGNVCINFTSTFLDWLKGIVIDEGVYRIRKREKHPIIEVFKVEPTGPGDIISQRFRDWREHRKEAQNEKEMPGAEGGVDKGEEEKLDSEADRKEQEMLDAQLNNNEKENSGLELQTEPLKEGEQRKEMVDADTDVDADGTPDTEGLEEAIQSAFET